MSPARVRLLPLALGLIAVIGFVALGVWQVERLAWKRALIAQVETRLAAAPVAAPRPAAWSRVGVGDVYTRVRATGRYRAGADSYVQAATRLGGGFWVLTPMEVDLQSSDHPAASALDNAGSRQQTQWTVLINRGFVPARGRYPAPAGLVTVTGLLRLTEPHGGFLRANDPAAERWYSRDVGAIAARRGLRYAAPYFIDASGPAAGWPRAGLTVVRFPNNHLVYAITWFALAALTALLLARALRGEAAA